MMIDIPLNETKPQIIGMFGVWNDESSFAPLVTSTIPNNTDLIVWVVVFGNIFERVNAIISKIFKRSKTSEIK